MTSRELWLRMARRCEEQAEDFRALAAETSSDVAVYVNQRTVEAIVGLPRRDYLREAAAGSFPTTKVRRLVTARTEDVIAFFEGRMRTARALPANDATPETKALARVGARRVASS